MHGTINNFFQFFDDERLNVSAFPSFAFCLKIQNLHKENEAKSFQILLSCCC